ncbi:hypothetical protein BT96DRAFT_985454 [Gymnopus androsaceus JB14]|uniref:Uncharacterized protein n=1 Tax=Gymnopus androsaceus JB14 TaxID=1447944 RepID=A0A6A4IFR8_9AGAR|nr:hypothetical protein BT96DRAFT_985454 [Gymnopus androsaceus JB14]
MAVTTGICEHLYVGAKRQTTCRPLRPRLLPRFLHGWDSVFEVTKGGMGPSAIPPAYSLEQGSDPVVEQTPRGSKTFMELGRVRTPSYSTSWAAFVALFIQWGITVHRLLYTSSGLGGSGGALISGIVATMSWLLLVFSSATVMQRLEYNSNPEKCSSIAWTSDHHLPVGQGIAIVNAAWLMLSISGRFKHVGRYPTNRMTVGAKRMPVDITISG